MQIKCKEFHRKKVEHQGHLQANEHTHNQLYHVPIEDYFIIYRGIRSNFFCDIEYKHENATVFMFEGVVRLSDSQSIFLLPSCCCCSSACVRALYAWSTLRASDEIERVIRLTRRWLIATIKSSDFFGRVKVSFSLLSGVDSGNETKNAAAVCLSINESCRFALQTRMRSVRCRVRPAWVTTFENISPRIFFSSMFSPFLTSFLQKMIFTIKKHNQSNRDS